MKKILLCQVFFIVIFCTQDNRIETRHEKLNNQRVMNEVIHLADSVSITPLHSQDSSRFQKNDDVFFESAELLKEQEGRYYQILLRRWQESAGHQKKEDETPINRRFRPHDIILIGKQAVEDYYNIEGRHMGTTSLFYIGEQNEHVIVRVRELPSVNEEVWVLVSRTTGRVLSMHKDILQPYRARRRIRTPDEIEGDRISNDRFNYRHLLQDAESNGIDQCWEPIMCNLPANNNHIDSVTAVAIAVDVAAQCYNSEITPFAARLMGENMEHLLVYAIFTVQDDIRKQNVCYNMLADQYRRATSPFFRDYGNNCPDMVHAVISMENCQILYMRRVPTLKLSL